MHGGLHSMVVMGCTSFCAPLDVRPERKLAPFPRTKGGVLLRVARHQGSSHAGPAGHNIPSGSVECASVMCSSRRSCACMFVSVYFDPVLQPCSPVPGVVILPR